MLGLIVPGFEPSKLESAFGRLRYRVCPTVFQAPGHLNAIRYVAGISPEAFDRFPAGPIAAVSRLPRPGIRWHLASRPTRALSSVF